MALTVDAAFVTLELREIWRCCWALGYAHGDGEENDQCIKACGDEIGRRVEVLHAMVDPDGRGACEAIVDEIDEGIAARREIAATGQKPSSLAGWGWGSRLTRWNRLRGD